MTHALTRSSSGAPAGAARHLAWAVVLVISAGTAQAQAPRAPGDNRATNLPAVPAMLHLALVQSQAAEAGPAYHVDRHGRGANPRHGLELAFTPEGARLEGCDGGFDLRLERFGRGDGRPVHQTAPRIDGAWVEIDRGDGLSEWFVNLPGGVEQGWTLARRPAGRGPLVLELDTARPPDRVDEGRLAWSGLVYHRLVALDADGRELPSVWAHDGARLRIEVDDRDAVYPVLIDPWVEQAKLTAEDGTEFDHFGRSVALAGDTALVGATQLFVGPPGAAYVFTRNGDLWSEQAKLTANDGAEIDSFGFSVALAGDTALVGAIGADVDGNVAQGAAYVFTRNDGSWSQQAKLIADDGAGFDAFGVSVALAGDTALVGAKEAAVDGIDQGAAYVFTRSGGSWSQQDKLTADDGAGFDAFGISVALAGDTALVGAVFADVDGDSFRGAAYLFTRSGEDWSQQDKLTADDGANFDEFGISVALAGDTALVGAQFANLDGNLGPGAAYVFTRSGGVWSQQDKLTADDEAENDHFGVSVALAGDTALVGSNQSFSGDPGAAYVFTRSGGVWSQQDKLTADDGADSDVFGNSVALASDTALVGAHLADVNGNDDQGAAYVYTFEGAVELAFDPPGLAFGDVAVDTTSDPMTATLENTGDAEATGIDFTLPGNGFVADTAACGDTLPAGTSCQIDVTFAPTVAGGATGTLSAESAEGATAEQGLGGNGVDETGVFVPMALAADPEALMSLSDGNLVFEPGERVEVAPTWVNSGEFPQFLAGTASGFTGPEGPTYDLVVDTADYGEVEPETSASCLASGMCYQMGIGPSGITRPALHWDAAFDETLTDETVETWTLHVGDSFVDVQRASVFYRSIETLLHRGVTGGCAGTEFCPDGLSTRAQMPVFMLKALHGPDYVPPACAQDEERFLDVPFDNALCPWITDLFDRGVVNGCGEGVYCPSSPVSRAQMAIFLLKTLEGPGYTPPECADAFDDVPCPSLFADWIEELSARGITSGCGGGDYCPSGSVSRAQMAVFITKTFGLTLYGP